MFVLKYYEGGVISNYKHVSLGVTGCGVHGSWPGVSGGVSWAEQEVGRWEGAGAALPVADRPAWG